MKEDWKSKRMGLFMNAILFQINIYKLIEIIIIINSPLHSVSWISTNLPAERSIVKIYKKSSEKTPLYHKMNFDLSKKF